MMLATAHEAAAPRVSAKPSRVDGGRCSATSTIPAPATTAPNSCARRARSWVSSVTRPIVKNTCIWMTRDARPVGMPAAIPANSRQNCSVKANSP